jgi:preprotein translocase subunit SecA
MLEQRMAGDPLPKGLDAVWDKGTGYVVRFIPRSQRYLRLAAKICEKEKHYSRMSDAKLRETAADLHEIFRCQRDNTSDLERAFALVREVAFRKIGERPYPVQVAGALALADGCVAELATGEGKTLAATMAVTVAGWQGKGCHVITVNDYLARRDAEWMGRIYRFCGLTVSHIEQQTPPAERREAYMSDITYCTNKEVTADFLRDRIVLGRLRGLSLTLIEKIAGGHRQVADQLVQRGLHYAVVDEADSILIDEAVTPLIISGDAPNPDQVESFGVAADIAGCLKPGIDYRIDQRYREIEFTDRGKETIKEHTSDLGGFWKGMRRSQEVINQALTAREFYIRDKNYIVEDGKIVIVDEFTGRLMPDRTWREGLHQAIEAKEKVEINPPKDTYARISFQRFFRMYNKLSGMTGTAAESSSEFWQIYHMPVVRIPTNRPCIRKNLPHIIMSGERAKWQRIVKEIRRVHESGRPVLVGTRSVRSSEHLSKLLNDENLDHQILNAVYHHQEAQIIAEAGQEGKITVATNMAGRGTDIKLGKGVATMGGLHVLAAEPNESGRVDRQLFGRGARQGDPGSAQGIFSLKDEVISRYAGNTLAYLKKRYARSSGEITSPMVRGVFFLAQRRAERLALRQRKSVLKTDHWLDEQLGFSGSE